MARSIDDITNGFLSRVPSGYWTLEPVFAGHAAQINLFELVSESLISQVRPGSSEDGWLTMLASGVGIDRATDERDEDLRERLRNPARKVVPSAIEAGTNALIASGTCTVIEHFKAPNQVIDVDLICDVSAIYDRRPGFTVLVPDELSNYPTLYAEILRIKAFGVPAWMVIED